MKLKVKVSVLIKSLGKIAIQKQNVILNDTGHKTVTNMALMNY